MLHAFILKIPCIGENYKKLQISKMFLALGFMLDSGINIVESLDKACNILDNILLIEMFKKSRQFIIRGESVSESLKALDILNHKHLILITSGEEKGDLSRVLINLSLAEEEELVNFLSKFTKYIEPMLITIMSLFVGILVITFFIPIIKLMDSLIGI